MIRNQKELPKEVTNLLSLKVFQRYICGTYGYGLMVGFDHASLFQLKQFSISYLGLRDNPKHTDYICPADLGLHGKLTEKPHADELLALNLCSLIEVGSQKLTVRQVANYLEKEMTFVSFGSMRPLFAYTDPAELKS